MTSVWGKEYLDFYLRHVLPYTRKRLPDGVMISCGTLAEYADDLCGVADFVMSTPSLVPCKYGMASVLDRVQMESLCARGVRRFIFQNPDAVISESALQRAATSAKPVITAPGIRIAKEEFLAIYGGFGGGLLANALTTLHPITLSLCRRGGYRRFSSGWPSAIYEVGEGAVTCRAFHRHPVMVTIPDGYDWSALPAGTVDDRFMGALEYAPEDFDNLTHSDQGWICEFSSCMKPLQSRLEEGADIDRRAAEFAASAACDDTHREFYKHEYTWSRGSK